MKTTTIELSGTRSPCRTAQPIEGVLASTAGAAAVPSGAQTGIARILTPIDFTAASMAVLEHAGAWAVRCGATVHLLHVLDRGSFANDLSSVPLTKGPQELASETTQRLSALARYALPSHVPAAPLVRAGKPVREIVRAAEALQSDLIVLGMRRGAWWWRLFASRTARRVVRQAPCPVLVVGAEADKARNDDALWDELEIGSWPRPSREREVVGTHSSACRLTNILVPIDFSACSKNVLRSAVELARVFDATLTLLYVAANQYPRPDRVPTQLPAPDSPLALSADELLAGLARDEVPADVPVRCVMRLGAPHQEILEAARQAQADLIVLCVHRHGALGRLVARGPAETVLRGAPCAVLTVPYADGAGEATWRPVAAQRPAGLKPTVSATWQSSAGAASLPPA
ncbi:MAG: universal stress protein [Verrucomicrobia bacterium]|nr:universal stress protein [Verrucomicrobiota bacterium]